MALIQRRLFYATWCCYIALGPKEGGLNTLRWLFYRVVLWTVLMLNYLAVLLRFVPGLEDCEGLEGRQGVQVEANWAYGIVSEVASPSFHHQMKQGWTLYSNWSDNDHWLADCVAPPTLCKCWSWGVSLYRPSCPPPALLSCCGTVGVSWGGLPCSIYNIHGWNKELAIIDELWHNFQGIWTL